MKATTKIEHGTVDSKGDNTVKTFNPGDTVTKASFTKEQWEQLLDSGAISDDGEVEPGIVGDRPWAAPDTIIDFAAGEPAEGAPDSAGGEDKSAAKKAEREQAAVDAKKAEAKKA